MAVQADDVAFPNCQGWLHTINYGHPFAQRKRYTSSDARACISFGVHFNRYNWAHLHSLAERHRCTHRPNRGHFDCVAATLERQGSARP